MALTAEKIADLVESTDKHIGRYKWTDISYSYQKHVAAYRLLQKKRVKFRGGRGPTWNVKVARGEAAKWVQLFERDAVNITDHMKKATLEWRHLTTNCAWERREFAMNQGPDEIYDLIKERQIDMVGNVAIAVEDSFWNCPPDEDDEHLPHGVFYHLVPNDQEGFYGGLPTGFTKVCGLSPTVYDQHRNWTFKALQVTKEDLAAKMAKAADWTDFTPPVPHPNYEDTEEFGYYTKYWLYARSKKLIEDQNDALGDDFDPRHGRVYFRGRPLEWVPALEAKDFTPIVGIPWSVFRTYFLRGEYMVRSKPTVLAAGGQHTTIVRFLDTTVQYGLLDRRRGFLGKMDNPS